MLKERAFLGKPIEYENLLIYPPTVEDVIDLEDFFTYLRVLTTSQNDLIDIYWKEHGEITSEGLAAIPTPFEYLLGLYITNPTFQNLINDAFLIFTHEMVTLDINRLAFLIGDREKELTKEKGFLILTNENLLGFQNTILDSVGMAHIESTDMDRHWHFLDREARSRNRDRVAAKQRGLSISLESLIASLCVANVGITPLNVTKLPYAALNVLKSKLQQKEEYERGVSIMTSGFAPKNFKIPSYWMGDIE